MNLQTKANAERELKVPVRDLASISTKTPATKSTRNSGMVRAIIKIARNLKLKEFTGDDLYLPVKQLFPTTDRKTVVNMLWYANKIGAVRRVRFGVYHVVMRHRVKKADVEAIAAPLTDELLDRALEALVDVETFVKRYRELRTKFAALQKAINE